MAAPTPIPEPRYRHSNSISIGATAHSTARSPLLGVPGSSWSARNEYSLGTSAPAGARDDSSSFSSSFTGVFRRVSISSRPQSFSQAADEPFSTSLTSASSPEPTTPPPPEHTISRIAKHLDACDADGTWPEPIQAESPREELQTRTRPLAIKRQPSIHCERILMGHLEA